eukprot:CAMPEP_0168456326 /NCGR_PEP_ID=MMETSP0228-20121227/51233_1 /TAXON_ID=133427 /ORGANISM="Protoceratium reticulatum, Strain CCCM 535 (=CCMP 1889)" /LENGTH=65 /DNA_ID=CAMNT_0008471249 /DNA_START=34 /DNA_END=228 /DNA_ORIENTATION=-
MGTAQMQPDANTCKGLSLLTCGEALQQEFGFVHKVLIAEAAAQAARWQWACGRQWTIIVVVLVLL